MKSRFGFPTMAGILLGLGLGGFFDGILLHQVLQWHHMLSSWYQLTSIENFKINILWDGVFHSTTYLFVVAGLFVVWRHSQRYPLRWPARSVVGSLLFGFGMFNVIEGVIDHSVLGIHHVNELVAIESRRIWDVAFLLSGVIMVLVGWWLMEMETRKGCLGDQKRTS